jgi:beta-phosphoglucomutase-like phosphatase (HAD superfamily)
MIHDAGFVKEIAMPDCSARGASFALIFDCDGTLADTISAHCQAWNEVLNPLGCVMTEERLRASGGLPSDVVAAQVLGIERWKAADIASSKASVFLRHLDAVRPIRKVVDIAAAHRGVAPMAVVSGGQRRVVEAILAQIGVLEWFSILVANEDVEHHKPSPDGFYLAANRMKMAATDCIVYEDADLGIEAAKRAGMKWCDVRGMR